MSARPDDVQQTLDKFSVPQPEQNEIKAIVESTHEARIAATRPCAQSEGSSHAVSFDAE
jgi:hypothetical protein